MKYLFMLALIMVLIQGCKKHDKENISTAKDLTGKVDLPTAQLANITVSSELDNASPANDGTFSINTHSILLAKNKQTNEPVYFGMPGTDESVNYILDAKETALYFAMAAVPNVRRQYYKPYIKKIKQAIYQFTEIKTLEQSIKNCINAKGYLDYSLIGSDIGNAVDKILTDIKADEKSYTSNRVSINPSYAAGGGYYRVDSTKPNGWEDKFDAVTNTYTLKRKMFNSTAAVVGVQIGKWNSANNSATLNNDYIGFVEPYYPPNLVSISGTKDNFIQFMQATEDLYNNGWDGFTTTDAYSQDNEFEFTAKANEKDAVVFVSGYYKPDVMRGINIAYVLIDNFQDIFEDRTKQNLFSKNDIVNTFLGDLVRNQANSTAIATYYEKYKNGDFKGIISDLKTRLIQFSKDHKSFYSAANMDVLINYLTDDFSLIAGSWSIVYKYSQIAYKIASAIYFSDSPKFSVAIPIEFDNIKLPPYPFQPSPFRVSLNNVSNINFQWKIDNTGGQNLNYNIYLSSDISTLSSHKIAANISTPNFNYSGSIAKNTRYYWQVEVNNTNGIKSFGAIWVFDNGIPKLLPNCIDGNGYNYDRIQIDNQIWTTENYRATKDTFGNILAITASGNQPAKDYMYYDNSIANYNNFGALYNAGNVNAYQNSIVPVNWRIPSKSDFENLLSHAGVDTFGFVTNSIGFNSKAGGDGYHNLSLSCGGTPVFNSANMNSIATYLSTTIGPNTSAQSTKYYALIVDYINHTARIREIEYANWSGFLGCGSYTGTHYYSIRLVRNN